MVELNGKLSIIMPAYNEEKLIYHSLISTLVSLVSSYRILRS